MDQIIHVLIANQGNERNHMEGVSFANYLYSGFTHKTPRPIIYSVDSRDYQPIKNN